MPRLIKDMDQNTPDWHKFRMSTIGSSDAPVIMGVSPWKTPLQLWKEKSGQGDDCSYTEYMRRGHDKEEAARALFEQITHISVLPLVYKHDDYDWMSASFDGISFDEKTLVEIKCPGEKDHAVAKSGKIPPKYYPQLQHQMSVANLTEMYYMSYNHDLDYALFKVIRDDAYVNDLIEKEKSFINLIETFTPPEDPYIDMSNDNEFASLEISYMKTCNEIENLEKEKKQLRDMLIEKSKGERAKGKLIKVNRIVSKGSVDYSKIPNLNGIDLDQYRNPPRETYRIDAI